MGLFDNNKLDKPIFLKIDSDLEESLQKLLEMRDSAPESVLPEIDKEIYAVKSGIAGENQIRFELENSHLPMYILHDLYFEHDGLSVQIDYMIITRKATFVLECKNLYGNISINETAQFTRTVNYGKYYKKEGIYSPITQNERHMEMIKDIRKEAKPLLLRGIFEKSFYQIYYSLVVLANPATVLNTKYAPKAIKNNVIRADLLCETIKNINKQLKDINESTDKEMKELADFYLSKSIKNPTDYTERIQKLIEEAKIENIPVENSIEKKNEECTNLEENPDLSPAIICPKCGSPMVLRTATRGENAGHQFYGCSRYPKCRCIVNIE